MDKLLDVVAELEMACESEASLLAYSMPDVPSIIAAIKELPLERQKELHGKMEWVKLMMEGKMLIYMIEIDQLKQKIRTVNRATKANDAYRTVAVLRIPNSPSTTIQ